MSFTITINSTDRTANVQWKSFRKRDNLNQQVDECTFEVWKYGSHTYEPTIGHEVIVTRNGSRVFGGVILRIDESVEAGQKVIYKVQCIDYSQYLKRQLVTKRYTNTTVGAIIADLVSDFTSPGDGITSNAVVGALAISSFSFNRISVADCLQKLADALSYVWYIDYHKDIHFFPKNTEIAPLALTDTSGNYLYNSLKITADLSQIRNSVLVQGGEVVSQNPRSELFSGDGARDTFALANKYDSLPTVTVNSSPQTVGVEFLQDDASFDVMWNFNEKYLRFTAGNTPGSGTNNIVVSGTYLFPILVKVPAPASIVEFGTYEFAILDRSIRSQEEAIERALAELKSYKSTMYEGSFRTYVDGLRSGQVITINSTQRGKSIDVLIQSVEAQLRDPSANALEYSVRFATLKSIGIIEYLQNQLRSKEVIQDDQETLTNFIPVEDTVGATDSLATPTTSTGPYTWNNFNWGYGVWQ
jgi:hypothetical protein